MKYIPYLIPKRSKVLPDYFKEGPYNNESVKVTTQSFLYVGSIVLFILGFITLTHPFLSLFFLIPGLCLLPTVHNWIEKTMEFEFTPKIKTVFIFALLICTFPLISYYNKADKEKEKIILAQKEKNRKIEFINQTKARQKHDSLELYIQKSNNYKESKHEAKALEKLKVAETFVSNSNEQKLIHDLRSEIFLDRAKHLVRAGKYKNAIPELNNLISSTPSNSGLLYQRAICLSKTGRTQEAVDDLRKSIDLGNTEAAKLYEKINPIKRRVAYYVTRCCDGTTSNATGRGACSHHSGVCNWNDPVYEEYRKY